MVKILVVDDEQDVEALIAQKFRRKVHKGEWSLKFARDGQEALETLRDNPDIDIVLSDINMPRMDGLTLTQKIKEEQFDLRTIVVSAYSDIKNIRVAMNNGAFDFITKPINFEDMETTIHRGFNNLQDMREALRSRDDLLILKKELNLAKKIQHSILPQSFDIDSSCPLDARMEPAKEVGGDFYDFFKLDDDHIAFLVADVSGKGVPAAIFAMVNQVKIRSLALSQENFSPSETLLMINESCCENNENCMFITLFYGVLNLKTGKMDYTNAGHNPPILMRPNGSCEWLPLTDDMAVGIMPGQVYSEKSIQLNSGETLFVYTDGVSECMDVEGQEFGEDRLMKEIQGVTGKGVSFINQHIFDCLKDFSKGVPQFDDMTYLVLRKESPE